jgi:hypothetical protein
LNGNGNGNGNTNGDDRDGGNQDNAETYPRDLVHNVAMTTGLDDATASRVVADVVAYFGQTVEEFVRQRHAELKDKNMRNDEIWPSLMADLDRHRFTAPQLTQRQLRRIVYGSGYRPKTSDNEINSKGD